MNVDGNRVSGFASETVAKAVPGIFRVLLAAWIGAVFLRVAVAPGIFGIPDAFTIMEAACVVGTSLAIAFGRGRP